MVWPLDDIGQGQVPLWKLKTAGNASGTLVFTYDPNDWRAAPVSASLVHGLGVALSPKTPFEPLIQACLRQSVKLTFHELTIVAQVFRIKEAHKMTRKNLLEDIFRHIGDDSFATFVREQEANAKKTKKQVVTNVDMCKSLLEGLDQDEVTDFMDIKEHVSEKAAVKRKWKDIADKRKEELNKIKEESQWVDYYQTLFCV